MTPEQCRELAEFHTARATRLGTNAKANDGLVSAVLALLANLESESARYWREKADG